MLVLGLDEAGRGSVLGPLVVGGFLVEKSAVEALSEAGATDSKKLSAKRREALIEPLGALGTAALREISARRIDGGNLNTLEEEAFASIILELRPDEVIIDAPCHPRAIGKFCARLLGRLDYEPRMTVEPKADLNYPPCGAASIFAKVTRDARIREIDGTVGSGYPSDQVTRDWIKGFIDRREPLPDSVRKRWGTIRALSQTELF